MAFIGTSKLAPASHASVRSMIACTARYAEHVRVRPGAAAISIGAAALALVATLARPASAAALYHEAHHELDSDANLKTGVDTPGASGSGTPSSPIRAPAPQPDPSSTPATPATPATSAKPARAETPDEARVRAWLTDTSSALNRDEGVRVVWRVMSRSTRDPKEITDRLKAIEGLPDHPDREDLELHKGLINPRVTAYELVYADPLSWWFSSSDDIGRWGHQAASGEGLRWSLFTGGNADRPDAFLVITPRGTPVPSGYNFGQLVSVFQPVLGIVLSRPSMSIPPRSDYAVKVSGEAWTATYRNALTPRDRPSGRNSSTLTISGTSVAGEPRLLAWVDSLTGDAMPIVSTTVSYTSESSRAASVDSSVRRIERTTRDGIVETFEVKSVQILTQSDVLTRARLPVIASHVRVEDWRAPDASMQERLAKGPTVTWDDQRPLGAVSPSPLFAAAEARRVNQPGLSTPIIPAPSASTGVSPWWPIGVAGSVVVGVVLWRQRTRAQ